MIENVSFVVIARNEEFAVDRCLRSLLSMPLANCEVLAIDSDSTDKTLNVMKKYASESPIVSVFRCSGYINAAIARNVGLDRAQKKYICFCDGDTEWDGEFVRQALEIMQAGEADAVTGGLKEKVYSPSYEKVLETKTRVSFLSRKAVYYSGGNFMVRKAVALAAGRWDDRMVRNQDIDYTLRVSRCGNFIGLPVCMGIHHTQHYRERIWGALRNGQLRFHGAVLKKNLDRPKVFAALVFQKNRGFLPGYAFYTLCIAGIVAGFLTNWLPLYVAAAPLSFVIADFAWGILRHKKVLKRFVTHYFYPASVLLGFLFGPGPKAEATTVDKVG